MVFRDFCVGRISVFHINLPADKRVVTERVIDPNHALRIQSIELSERAPAILSIQKFVRQAKCKLPMVSEITDRANAEFLRLASRHHERISIVESERPCHTAPE